ncbi:MAG: protein BatD [Anaerolineae bacterium]|nr:protein BatD [Anaerolineae bacterium]
MRRMSGQAGWGTRRRAWYCVLLVVASVLSGVLPVWAQNDTTFTATVDRTSLPADQILTLQLTLAGAFGNAGRPELPALDGFMVVGSSQSSQFTMVNGKTSSQMTFIYQLQPTRTGALTIPAVTIQVNGQTYQTQPVAVEVTQGAAPQTPPPAGGVAPDDLSAPEDIGGQSFYVEAEVDNPMPVVGQQIIYTFRLYQAANFFSQPQLAWPKFTGFISYDLSPNTQYNQTINGQAYLVTEVRRALFPAQVGELTLEPAVLSVPDDFFNRGFALATKAVTVNVQSLPDGAPDGFVGAVGQFTMTATLEPAQSRVNEPVTLIVRVSGTGNVSAVPDPTDLGEEAFPGWRVFDSQITTDVKQQGISIQGEKVFERLLVPKTEGVLTVPALKLVFFDPGGMYRTATTEPIEAPISAGDAAAAGPVVIGDGKQDVVVLGSDIRHIKAAPAVLRTARRAWAISPLYWAAWLASLFAVVGVWRWERRQHALAHDVAYARTLRARKQAQRQLAEAEKLLHKGGGDDVVYAAVARALLHYLGDKYNLPAAGLTRDTIRRALAARAVSDDLAGRVLVCLDWADSGRFAPVAAGRNAADLVRDAEAVITTLEGALGQV